MDLGARVPALLAHCAGAALSDAQVAAVAAAAVAAVASAAPAEASLGADAAASAPLREALAGVATLVAEAARLNLTAAELKCACPCCAAGHAHATSPDVRAHSRCSQPR
jgi:hypothetical protein